MTDEIEQLLRNSHLKQIAAIIDDELAHLTTVFNQLLDRVETSFEQLRRFTSDASHELRSPLNAILGWIRLLRSDKLSEDDVTRALERWGVAAQRDSLTARGEESASRLLERVRGYRTAPTGQIGGDRLRAQG